MDPQPDPFLNRELTWLAFNRRVLDEARDPANPILERVKFLAIASTNLDEFFEIRVANAMERANAGLRSENPDGMTARDELNAVRDAARQFTAEMHACWREELVGALAAAGVLLPRRHELTGDERAWLRDYFEREVFPVLTPLAVDPAHPFPNLLNKSLNLAVLLLDAREARSTHRLAVVQVPRVLPRLIKIGERGDERAYAFMVDIVKEHLDQLFPGLEVRGVCSFRVTRDSNLDLDEDESTDLLQAVETELHNRRRGEPVRLEIDRGAPAEVLTRFLEALDLEPADVHECAGPVNLGRLLELYRIEENPALKDPPFLPRTVVAWESAEAMFANLRARDVLLHHPYDAFGTVEDFVRLASTDPRVLAIKHTIYRAGETSPIVRDLIRAAERRKMVTVVVELKARFDEEANIRWARRMERAGVHVVYGIVGLKTHAKATLIVRREDEGIRRYCHLGTGNYNPTTARVYTDLGLLTAHRALCKEVADLFNMITGYSEVPQLELLSVAPFRLRAMLTESIRAEAEHARAGRPARIRAKLNGLVDPDVIGELYAASQAGVEIRLCVRGICCLRPGVPGLSESITVVSVVGRFLEHSRIYCFENGGDPRVWAASADWMPRNLDRRVEACFPLLDPDARARAIEILDLALADNVKGREILADGGYRRRERAPDEPEIDSQRLLREQAAQRDLGVIGPPVEAEPPRAERRARDS